MIVFDLCISLTSVGFLHIRFKITLEIYCYFYSQNLMLKR